MLQKIDIAVQVYDSNNLSHAFQKQPLPDIWIHIVSEQSLIKAGEEIYQIRQKIGNAVLLIACIPMFPEREAKSIMQCGASAIITPATWAVQDVGDRILGELLLRIPGLQTRLNDIHGGSPVMQKLYDNIVRFAKLEETILILGEAGAGKELVANAVHALSMHSQESFLPINCGCLGRETMVSTLFGHRRGAFTGAIEHNDGLFVAAGHGTIFLDEIGELPYEAQPHLLRVIEEKRVLPLGSTQYVNVPARLVLATNRNLEELCSLGQFRSDLYERIRGFSILVYPLRERKADIPMLTQHFVNEFNAQYKKQHTVPSYCIDRLFRYHWPGNIRELRNVVRRAAAYADDEKSPISVPHLYASISQAAKLLRSGNLISFDPSIDTWADVQERLKKAYFTKLLEYAENDKTKAAALAEISRSQLYEILKLIRKD